MKKLKENEELIEEIENDPDKKRAMTVDSLIEKGKKGKLSQSDLDEMLEEMDFDVDQIDKLYEELEDNGINLNDNLSSEEMSAIENEVARFSAAEAMESA